jgi:hypothetical protein
VTIPCLDKSGHVDGGNSSTMPSLKEHCDQTTKAFGKPFEQVHVWLDAFAGKAPLYMRHRRKRHHLDGVENVRAMYGDQAAEVARMHIEADLLQEGSWNYGDEFPRNEAHYISMGLF